ncbi:MAG: hypothetical protein GXO23_01160 [Crenarchaeota archaeon]|nr:hypothetical protein [Thermoproteota archaeon]
MQESIILAISSSEEFIKKILNVSTVYVFRTFGARCKVFGMFLISPGRILREPSSVCVYADNRGDLTYVTSVSSSYVNNRFRSSGREIAIVLDMYNPPCVTMVRFLCYLSETVEVERELELAGSFELYREVSDDNYLYMIYRSRDLNPRSIALTVITMILYKSYLEKKITKEDIARAAAYVREKLRTL